MSDVPIVLDWLAKVSASLFTSPAKSESATSNTLPQPCQADTIPSRILTASYTAMCVAVQALADRYAILEHDDVDAPKAIIAELVVLDRRKLQYLIVKDSCWAYYGILTTMIKLTSIIHETHTLNSALKNTRNLVRVSLLQSIVHVVSYHYQCCPDIALVLVSRYLVMRALVATSIISSASN